MPPHSLIKRMYSSSCLILLASTSTAITVEPTKTSRIYTHHSCRPFNALYELPSKVLHHCILCILSARRGRRPCRACSWRNFKIWRSPRHGDRPVSFHFKFLFDSIQWRLDVLHLVCCAISPRHILPTPSASSSSSLSTSVATTCICTGMSSLFETTHFSSLQLSCNRICKS